MTPSVIEYSVPNKGLVVVSLDEKTWPREVDEVGYVPRWALVPDPDQPRDEDDFEESGLIRLGENLKVNGQSEAMKVRLLTEEERDKFALSDERRPFYMLSSGERRWRSAGPEPKMANIPILRICVAVYADADAQFLDAFVINADREDLGVLSTARSLQRLLVRNAGGNVSELCRISGKSRPTVDKLLRIANNLVDEAKPFLSMKLKESDRMGSDLAAFLAKFSHDEQRRWIQPLMVTGEAGKTMGQKMRWIEDQLFRSGNSRPARREEAPVEYRQRVQRLLDQVRINADLVMGASDQVFATAFRDMDATACKSLLEQFEVAAVRLMAVQGRVVGVTVDKKNFVERNKDLLPGWRMIDYYENGRTLKPDALISPQKYESLKKMRWLAWQMRGEPDPDATLNAAPAAETSSPALPSLPAPSLEVQAPAQAVAKAPSPARDRRIDRVVSEPLKTNGHSGATDGYGGMLKVSFFERTRPGGQEQLVQNRPVNRETYTSLQRDRKLLRQQHGLPASDAEKAFCVKMGISIQL